MENKNTFTHSVYEVLSENTQKYAATGLSGGEIGKIQSTTTHYSDQALWLKDIKTGKERKFDFQTFNVAVREGHKLLCVWREPDGKLEAVKNLSTDSTVLGIDEFSKGNLSTWIGIVTMAFVFGAVFLIPYVGAAVYFITFLIGVTPVGNLKTKSIPFYRIAMLLVALFYACFFYLGFENGWFKAALFTYAKNLFLVNFAIVFATYAVANNYVVNGRQRLKEYLENATQENSQSV